VPRPACRYLHHDLATVWRADCTRRLQAAHVSSLCSIRAVCRRVRITVTRSLNWSGDDDPDVDVGVVSGR
jgi:hypothetical protein